MSDDLDRKPPASIQDYLENTKESFRVYAWVWREMINDIAKNSAKKMMALLCLSHMLTLTLPFLVGALVDYLIANDMIRVWWTICGIATVMFLGRGVFSYQFMKIREIILGEFLVSLDERSNALFFEKSLGQHLKENEELSASNVEKGRSRILEIESMMMFEGLDAFMSLVIAFIFLTIINWIAGLMMGSALLVYVLWSLFLNKRVMEVCVPIDRDYRALNRHRVERWEQIERVKTCAKEHEEHEFMDTWFSRLIGEDRAFWMWFIARNNLRGMVHVAALIGVLMYGAVSVQAGTLAIGMLVPLFVWSRMMSDNMWRIGHVEHRLNWNMPAVRSMMKALTIEPDIVDEKNPHHLASEPVAIEFNNISFEYVDSGKKKAVKTLPVLKNVSFDVQPGEVVALLGKSGAGKTTIMRLLQRGMDPTHGNIRVNGVDLKEIKIASLLEQTGYIAQQPAVLSGTLKYNLLYGLAPEERDSITDDMLWNIMRKLELDLGDRLTDGLETKVGKKGVKLSGGEAQRVMIGAAVLKQPNLMIIDEATSSLDSTTERAVQKGLAEVLTSGMSGLIIAHRLSTVREICDKFVVIRSVGDMTNGDNQVEAIGSSFEELWDTSPTFRQLAIDQGITITQ